MTWLRHIYFLVAFSVLCWHSMMVLHELGHVIGAWSSGGVVRAVVLHPQAISRTDVRPNPFPLFVAWMGPVAGCALPAAIWMALPSSLGFARGMSQFFLGFCLIANGAYIGVGAFEGIGDAGELLRHGSPFLGLLVFGLSASCCGFWAWHHLGSPAKLLTRPLKAPLWAEVVVTLYLLFVMLFCLAPVA
jgi:hypothetical protein